MAWTGFPVSSSTNVNKYEHFIQLWRSCRERYIATSSTAVFWPRQNVVHSSGIVSAITSSGMTAADGHYDARPIEADGKWGENEWYNFSDGLNPHIPNYYDLIIDYCNRSEEDKVVRADILPHASGNTINISDISKYETMGWIPSVASLVGKPFYIIKDGGLWHKDRFPSFPNEQEFDKGTQTSSNHFSITDTGQEWEDNAFSNKEVLFYATNGLLYRENISSNSSNTIVFPSGDRVPVGNYVVVTAGNKADPDRESAAPFYWYGGAKEYINTHLPDDTISTTNLPTNNVQYETGIGCTTEDHTAFDIDVWKDYDDDCQNQTSDKCFSPNLFKSIRQIQTFLEEICHSYVKKQDYHAKKSIPLLNQATFFKEAGINWQQDTYTVGITGSGHYNYSIPYAPIDAYYSVLNVDTDDDVITFGSTTFPTTSGNFDINLGTQYSGVNTNCILSFGWTRFFPKEFRYMYDNTSFIPDDNGGVPAMPEEDGDFAGLWLTRDQSSKYKDHTQYGFVQEGDKVFIGSDLARYSGDNWNDPTLDVTAAWEDYYDNFFEGIRNETNQGLIDFYMFGFAGGDTSTRHLTDDDKDWWSLLPQEGILRTETGTATGGSTTSLIDTSKSASVYWDGTTGRWTGFILEMTTGSASGQKFPITSNNTTTLNFTAYSGYSIANGDTYQIREPKWTLNRWQGRTLRVTKQDNTTADIDIKYSDDKTLFFDPVTFTIPSGAVYAIIEKRPGGVWKYSAGIGSMSSEEADEVSSSALSEYTLNDNAWVAPTGYDSRGANFKSNQNNNLAHVTKKYGRFMKGDYVARHLWNEVCSGINVLKYTKIDFDWTNKGEPNQWKYNKGVSAFELIPHYVWDDGTDAGTVYWTNEKWSLGSGYGVLGENKRPYAIYTGMSSPSMFSPPDHEFTSNADTTWSYGKIASGVINGLYNHEVEWFVYSEITGDAVDEGHTEYENNVFDNNGDDDGGAFQYRRWTRYDTSGPDNNTGYHSDACGNTSFLMPNECPEPDKVSGLFTSRQGYYVTNECAIIKWDVANGFDFV